MDSDLPKSTQTPLSEIHGSPKDAGQAIGMEEDEEEEEVMRVVVEKKKSKKKKKKKEKTEDEEEEEVMTTVVVEKKKSKKKKKEDEEEEDEEEKKKHFQFSNQLHKYIINGDWENAKIALKHDPLAITRPITSSNDIALHVVFAAKKPSMKLIEKIVDLMSESDLETLNQGKRTALHHAAIVGNTEAAKIFVRKNPSLTKFRDSNNETPLHLAAEYNHEKTVWFLLGETREVDPSVFAGEDGALLLNYLIMSELYGVAIHLLQDHPNLAIQKDTFGCTPLSQLARQTSSFSPENQLNFLQRLLYKCICVKKDNVRPREDVENPAAKTKCCLPEPKQWTFKFLQRVYNTKLRRQFTKKLCAETAKSITLKKDYFFVEPVLKAARLGNHELVWEIVKAFPAAMHCQDENQYDIFHLAVLNRKEKVYSLKYRKNLNKDLVISSTDRSSNNILHLAGQLGPSGEVSGAAFHMQRELQWFKEVEEVAPSYRLEENEDGKTPWEVFTESHKDLAKEGQKWMKDTATSCTVVAALVVTVAFAAAFTLPGGNDSEGFPIFLKDSSFMIFAVSNALALLASSTSLLMFLGILTSRYSEEDFRIALPMRLCIGLATLFLSIAFMLAAFGSTLHIVLVRRLSWVAVPIVVLACVPLTLFVFLQFPLLIKMVSSSFGPSISGRRSKETKCCFTCRIKCWFTCGRNKEIGCCFP